MIEAFAGLLLLLGLAAIPSPVSAGPGDLDTSFRHVGRLLSDLGPGAQGAYLGIARQADGKLVVMGQYTVDPLYSPDLSFVDSVFLERLLENGERDGTFGSGGLIKTSIGVPTRPVDLLQANDGSLLVVGATTPNGVVIVHYLPDGTLDHTFGTGGIARSTLIAALHAVLAADGKLFVAGFSRVMASEVPALARFNTDGTLDATFGGDGVVVLSSPNLFANGLAIQPDGKLVVISSFGTQATHYSFGVARILPDDGALDATFGTGGVAFFPTAR